MGNNSREQSFYDSWKPAAEILRTIHGAVTYNHTRVADYGVASECRYRDSGSDRYVIDFYDRNMQYMQSHHGLVLMYYSRRLVYCHINKINPLDTIAGSNIPPTIMK